jgi:hypothetical protein
MSDYRQNRFPFDVSVAPAGGEPVLFDERFQVGQGGNWAAVPGVTATLPGTQFPPSRYGRFDPSAQMPPGGSSYVDVTRRGLALQSLVPPLAEYCWTGYGMRTGLWSVDDDAFTLQLFSRVGLAQEFVANHTTPSGYAGAIVSLSTIFAGGDGPFISLGMGHSADGPVVQISKWSDHATLVEVESMEARAPSVFVRALINVDPEDGLTVRYPEFSFDGWGWRLFSEGELVLSNENEGIAVGWGSTGFTDGEGGETMSAFAGPTQLFGPYPDTDDARFALRMATQGGCNWP